MGRRPGRVSLSLSLSLSACESRLDATEPEEDASVRDAGATPIHICTQGLDELRSACRSTPETDAWCLSHCDERLRMDRGPPRSLRAASHRRLVRRRSGHGSSRRGIRHTSVDDRRDRRHSRLDVRLGALRALTLGFERCHGTRGSPSPRRGWCARQPRARRNCVSLSPRDPGRGRPAAGLGGPRDHRAH